MMGSPFELGPRPGSRPRGAVETSADITAIHIGTLWLVTPISEDGWNWCREWLPDPEDEDCTMHSDAYTMIWSP
jgi:hypothetical protein